jgi:hypothetical protein
MGVEKRWTAGAAGRTVDYNQYRVNVNVCRTLGYYEVNELDIIPHLSIFLKQKH